MPGRRRRGQAVVQQHPQGAHQVGPAHPVEVEERPQPVVDEALPLRPVARHQAVDAGLGVERAEVGPASAQVHGLARLRQAAPGLHRLPVAPAHPRRHRRQAPGHGVEKGRRRRLGAQDQQLHLAVGRPQQPGQVAPRRRPGHMGGRRRCRGVGHQARHRRDIHRRQPQVLQATLQFHRREHRPRRQLFHQARRPRPGVAQGRRCRRGAAAEHQRVHRLGHPDEGRVEGQGDEGQAGGVGGPHQGRRHHVELPPQLQHQAHHPGAVQVVDVGRLPLRRDVQNQARGQQQLAPRQQPSDVQHLGDVAPAHRPVQPPLPRHHPRRAEHRQLQDLPDADHRPSLPRRFTLCQVKCVWNANCGADGLPPQS